MLVAANDYVGHWIQISGGYEYEVLFPALNFVQKLLGRQPQTCLDVGANIGNHTIVFSQHFNNVVAIEANPYVYELLKLNTNSRENITSVCVAVGENNKQVFLCLADETNEGTGFIEFENNLPNSIPIAMRTLDEIVNDFDLTKDITSVDLIKIDVEGMETSVLRGAKEVIQKFNPIILFEYYVNQNEINNTFDMLDSFGYSKYYYVGTRYDNKNNKLIQKMKHFVLDTIFNTKFYVKFVPSRERDYNMVIAIPEILL